MKLLHTADWHLGKKLSDSCRLSEQEKALKEICAIANKEDVDLIVIAGDLYDSSNPSNKAIELFYETLYKLTKDAERAVIAIAGNHDSPDRIEAPDPLARQCGIIFSGFPNTKVPEFSLASELKVLKSSPGFIELQLPKVKDPLRILLTPYPNEARLRKFTGTKNPEQSLRSILKSKWNENADQFCDNKGINILISHLFMTQNDKSNLEEPEDEKHILYLGGTQAIFTKDIPPQIQYTALGHLHRYQHIKGHKSPVVYSGSLLEYNFRETDQQKYVVIVELSPKEEAIIKPIEIKSGKKLCREQFENIDEAISWLKENPKTYVELTLESDSYLTASEIKKLYDVHSNIVKIIPEITNHTILNSKDSTIDLSKDPESLFKDYFKEKKEGQEANQEILDVLKEVLSEN